MGTTTRATKSTCCSACTQSALCTQLRPTAATQDDIKKRTHRARTLAAQCHSGWGYRLGSRMRNHQPRPRINSGSKHS
jgi:hypothetical protein